MSKDDHMNRCAPDLDNYAYSTALAFESINMSDKWDPSKELFGSVTHYDLERFARTVAYKVAHNLRNGFKMSQEADPLEYINCNQPDWQSDPVVEQEDEKITTRAMAVRALTMLKKANDSIQEAQMPLVFTTMALEKLIEHGLSEEEWKK